MTRTLPRLALTLALLLTPLAAQAHTTSELDAWMVEWVTQADDSFTADLLNEYADMRTRHPWYFHSDEDRLYAAASSAVRSYSGMGSGGAQVERWRSLVATYFEADEVERALCLINAESGGNPDARNTSSGASGLFQHLPKYWVERSNKAGWSGADIFDPTANVAVAAWLQNTGGWTHWSPYNRGACR